MDSNQTIDSTADESANCIAPNKEPLDIFLLIRNVDGLNSMEKQLIASAPPPYIIGVDKGQNVDGVIRGFYSSL